MRYTNIPRTPFSTALSGSAKETERRLKNIFSGPKKRPPVLFLLLIFAVCLLCGNLVSCQMAEAEDNPPPQDYDLPDISPVDVKSVPVDPDAPPQTEEEEWLLQALFLAADEAEPFQVPTARLLNFIQQGGRTLAAVFVEDHLENTLILGVVDKETKELTGNVFRCSYHIGVPNLVSFQDYDGNYCLLYTFNGQMNGQYTGEAGMLRFDGESMTWQWPVEGDIQNPDTLKEYQTYWNGRLAVAAPGGVDIYSVNPDFQWGGDDPWSMWQLETDEIFYADPSSATDLPMPIYFDALRWLIDYTNDPGGWRIVSLTRDEERSDPENQVDCFVLEAREEFGDGGLTADLFFPYESELSRPKVYGNLERGEIYETYQTSPAQRDDPDKWDDEDDWNWIDKQWEIWDEEWEKEQEAKQIAEYQSVGVTMDGKGYYYQDQLVNIFLDQRPDKSVYTLDRNPSGTVNVKILRSDDGTITGAAYLTSAEAAELNELFED